MSNLFLGPHFLKSGQEKEREGMFGIIHEALVSAILGGVHLGPVPGPWAM